MKPGEYWDGRYNTVKAGGASGMMTADLDRESLTVASWVVDNVNVRKHGSVIDYGCGSARWTRYLLEAFAPAVYTGMDIAHKTVNGLRDTYKFPAPVCGTFMEAFENVALPVFDLLWSFTVFQHMDRSAIVDILREAHEAGNAGAYVIAVENTTPGMPERDYIAYRSKGEYINIFLDGGWTVTTPYSVRLNCGEVWTVCVGRK